MDRNGQAIEDILATLSVEETRILLSLPYRAGLYVSFADVTGGWDAQESEMQSLTNILRQHAEDYCKSEFAQKVLMECLRARAQWPAWAQRADRLPEETKSLMAALAPHFTAKELNAFREVIVDIALSVAMAFREAEAPSENGNGTLLGQVKSLFGARKDGVQMAHGNISAKERAALTRLCDAIGHRAL